MTIFRFETRKLTRSRRPLIAAFSLLSFLALMLLGFYTYAQNETRGRAEFRYTFESKEYFNGLTFAIYAFYFGIILLLPVIATIEGGSQVAGETSSGTIQLLLVRPVSRSRLFLAKAAISAVLLFLIVGLFLIAALVIGLFAVGWGDLDLYPGVLQMTDRPQHLSQAAALSAFFQAWPAASIALLAPLSMSLLISTWTRNPVNAVGISVSLYLVMYLISNVHFFTELRPYLFTSYVGYWRGLFRAEPDWAMLLRDGAKLMAFAAFFLGLAYRRFRVREEV